MTKQQQIAARIIWVLLGILGLVVIAQQRQPLAPAYMLIGWFGGVAFVFACLVKADK